MKKILATLLTLSLYAATLSAQVVINEFMSNCPGAGVDSIEFIELYNAGSSTVDISNWSFSQGVTYTFDPGTMMPAGAYIVLTNDTMAMAAAFGVVGSHKWTGALTNGGEDITLVDDLGNMVDSVDYGGTGWTTISNSDGFSLELCNIAGNHNDFSSWSAGSNPTGVVISAIEVLATPGAMNTCTVPPAVSYPLYTIDQINGTDANGAADSMNVTCELRGIAHCVDLRGGNGLDFPFANSNNNAGVRVFSFSDVDNYLCSRN